MTRIRSDSVQIPGLRIHYRHQGDPDGIPLLLVHGSFATGRWWEPLMEVLPDSVRVVAPDLRGCGESEKPEEGYSIEEMADDVWSFASQIGLRDFDLVGHAIGGAVAAEVALEHVHELHSLTLVDSVPLEGVQTPGEMLVLLTRMRDDRDLLRSALSMLMPSLSPGGVTDRSGESFLDILVEDSRKMAPAAFTEMAVAASRWNRFEQARRLTLPTLLVWGELDSVVDRDSTTRSLIAIPGASNLEVLQGVGHCPMIEKPLAFAEVLIDFITDDFAEFGEIRDSAQPDENASNSEKDTTP